LGPWFNFFSIANGFMEGIIMIFALVMIAKDWRSPEEKEGTIYTISITD